MKRAHVWLEGPGEWTWPGTRPPAGDFAPPSWVPAFPPRLEPVTAGAGGAGALTRRRVLVRRIWLGLALSLAAALGAVTALGGPAQIERALGLRESDQVAPHETAAGATPVAPPPVTLRTVTQDAAGSAIVDATYDSPQLASAGFFYAYLPPEYASSDRRYPVLYLLHGRQGHADAFLEMGIQASLDGLIAARKIPPMIVVMVQDRPTLANWRDIGVHHSAGYVAEVQELVDRTLATIPTRAQRAIAGSSMGGFGAMHVALLNPYRFGVVESWLGYFNNLEDELRADRPVYERLGLQAFLYGAEEDPVAEPWEDSWFAGRLRAAGAHAQSAVYPGGHSLQKVREHLDPMLLFVGRAFERAQAAQAARQAAAAGAHKAGASA